MHTLLSTQFERERPSVTSPVYGALARGTALAVAGTLDLWETNDAIADRWLHLASGRWLPQTLGGHHYVQEGPGGG